MATNRDQQPTRRHVIRAASALAAPFVITRRAWAAFPDRPIKILVPNPVGGPADISARLIAPMLGEAIGGTVFVENKPGAGGNIGISTVVRSEPDGYTLLLTSNQLMIATAHFETLPFDPIGDLAPISHMVSMPNCVLANPSLGVSTFAELTALARKDAGKLNATTSGLATAPHVGFEWWRRKEKLDIGYVPTGGSGPAAQALISGTVSVYWGALASIRGHIDSGAAKLLVLLAAKRWHDLPNVPTWTEIGNPPPDYNTIMNLLAPAKTPPEIIAQISKALVSGLRKPENVEKLRKAGADVVASSPDELKALIAREIPLWKATGAEAGIVPKKE